MTIFYGIHADREVVLTRDSVYVRLPAGGHEIRPITSSQSERVTSMEVIDIRPATASPVERRASVSRVYQWARRKLSDVGSSAGSAIRVKSERSANVLSR